MSGSDPSSDPRDCGAEAAGYALSALGSDEAERYRRHVSTCAVCRDEVAALQGIVDVLPMAAPQLRAPRDLKLRMLSRVEAGSKGTANAYARRRLWLGAARSAFTPLAKRGPVATAGVLAAAAASVAALAFPSGSSRPVNTVPTAVISEGQFARAVLQVSTGYAELTVSHMPAPPGGKIYQVWLKHPGKTPQPTDALFSVTSRGTATVAVPGDLRGVSEVLVSPEPLGGSTAPTHAPVIVAALAS